MTRTAAENYGTHCTAGRTKDRDRECLSDAVAVTALDGREHLVPDYALAEGWQRGDGLYPAWCGMWVAGASMCEPPGRPCGLCSCVAQVACARQTKRCTPARAPR